MRAGNSISSPFSRGEKNLSGPRRSQAVPSGPTSNVGQVSSLSSSRAPEARHLYREPRANDSRQREGGRGGLHHSLSGIKRNDAPFARSLPRFSSVYLGHRLLSTAINRPNYAATRPRNSHHSTSRGNHRHSANKRRRRRPEHSFSDSIVKDHARSGMQTAPAVLGRQKFLILPF